MHAVVVDPSRVVLKLIAELIGERGDRVSEFSDAAAALRAVKDDPSVDVLITSLEVQPMTGLELCWEARLAMAARRPLFIIVMSSLSDEQKLAETLDCGADDLIAKPVKRLELHARMRMAGRLKAAQLHLLRLAETDGLTALLNRRAFFERVGALTQMPDKAPGLSAILLDIDHFKRINDAHGHDAGDRVIQGIAAQAAKAAKLVGRLGGEEFALILEDQSDLRVRRIAENLRQQCERLRFKAQGASFSATCSFGISHWVRGDSADTLLKRADIALYLAKSAGRNCVEVATAETLRTYDERAGGDQSARARSKARSN
jgi:diguanylate cyclase (GGDEF)-like protein